MTSIRVTLTFDGVELDPDEELELMELVEGSELGDDFQELRVGGKSLPAPRITAVTY